MTNVMTRFGHLVQRANLDAVNVLGPTIEYVTEPANDDGPCLMIGTIPPGVVVPIHSHDEPETFIPISGRILGLAYRSDEDFDWVTIEAGKAFHVPPGAKHGFRNPGQESAVMYIVSTGRIGRFFREVGERKTARDTRSHAPSPEATQRFLAVAKRYGYWNGTAELSNAASRSIASAVCSSRSLRTRTINVLFTSNAQ